MKLNSKGIAHLVVVLIVVVVGVVGFAGYYVATHKKTSEKTSQDIPAKIESKSDLDQASKALDSGSDSELDPSQLDDDLNDLL